MDANSAEGGSDHCGDESRGRGRVRGDHPGSRGALDHFGEEGRADSALLLPAAVAVGARSSASEVHEEAKLKGNVELRVRGDSKPHLVALALLVILAHEAVEGGAAAVLVESCVEVRVKLELAGEGCSSLGRAHAAAREGTDGVLVAEGQEVRWVGSE